MKRISSKLTFISKWVFPIVFFGFLVVFFVDSFQSEGASDAPLVVWAAPLFMSAVALIVMRYFIWDLADSVYDHGSYLVVRRNGTEARIQIENIMNVSSTVFVNPPRVTLRLVQACALGSDVSFSPTATFSLNPFAKSAVAEDLMQRAYAARAKASA